jgi:hypothetical protein
LLFQLPTVVSVFPDSSEPPVFTPQLERALERARQEAGGGTVDPRHLLLGLVAIGEGGAFELLSNEGITAEFVRGFL